MKKLFITKTNCYYEEKINPGIYAGCGQTANVIGTAPLFFC